MAKKLEMPRKAEKQFQELKARFKITRREFLDYYNAVRKANKKLSTKTYKQKAFLPKSFTLNVGFIKTKKIFTQMSKNVSEVLQRGFTRKANKRVRENVYGNLVKQLGYDNAQIVLEKFNQLSDAEFKQYFENNYDLKPLMYYDQDEILNFIDVTLDKILSRF